MTDTQIVKQAFAFEGNQIHILMENQNPLFRANDVCRILGFGNPRQALQSHVDKEDVQKLDTPSESGTQSYNYVNESGLYCLSFGSKKPAAKKFKRWVTSEVLPTIRKTGSYSIKKTAPLTLQQIRVRDSLFYQLDYIDQTHGLHKETCERLRKPIIESLEQIADGHYPPEKEDPEPINYLSKFSNLEQAELLITEFTHKYFQEFPHADNWIGNAAKLMRASQVMGIQSHISTKSLGRALVQLAKDKKRVQLHRRDEKQGNIYVIY